MPKPIPYKRKNQSNLSEIVIPNLQTLRHHEIVPATDLVVPIAPVLCFTKIDFLPLFDVIHSEILITRGN